MVVVGGGGDGVGGLGVNGLGLGTLQQTRQEDHSPLHKQTGQLFL